MWTVSQYFLGLCLNWLIAEPATSPYDGPLGAVWIGLYISPTGVLTPVSTMANITEATYDGYQRQEVVWYPPYIAGSGPYTLEAASLHFRPTGSVTSNLITGVFMADAHTGGNLLMSCPWPQLGASLMGPATALTVDAIFQLPFTLIYGGPDLSN